MNTHISHLALKGMLLCSRLPCCCWYNRLTPGLKKADSKPPLFLIYECIFSRRQKRTEDCFPSLLRVLGVFSPVSLGGCTHETTGAQ